MSRVRTLAARLGASLASAVLGTAALAALAALPSAATAAGRSHGTDPTTLVDPFVGTAAGAPDFGTGGGAGNTFPGASLPFGMVQFSPDTFPANDNFAAGYSYRDTRLRGFSLNHISGAGCAGLQDVSIVPVAGRLTGSPATPGSYDLRTPYRPTFTHAAESAVPGAYTVTLDPGGAGEVRAELTATTRTGDARLRYPTPRPGSVLFNLGGSAMGDTAADVRLAPSGRELTGSVQSGYFCYENTRYSVYFAARFSRPFAAYGTWTGARLAPGSRSAAERTPSGPVPPVYRPVAGGPPAAPGDPTTGVQTGAYVTFAPSAAPVELQVGLSYVSVGGALANLHREATGRSFAALRTAARRAWRTRLSQITLGGGSRANRRTFYTALYHAELMPNVYSDVDGRYRGMDGRVHRSAGTEYANYSGWDIYRSQFPLVAMLDPAAAADMARSLIDEADTSSGQLPKWSLLGTENEIMTGDPADALIAEAYAFGARRFPVRHALADLVAGATRPGQSTNNAYVERAGLADYLRLGYVPVEDNTSSAAQTVVHSLAWGSVATTLEYALDDFAIARLARAVGQPVVCRRFAGRSENWRRTYNPADGYVQLRHADGTWATPFSPTSEDGFAEGDAAQYTWFVPQDVSGLAIALGGRATAARRLADFLNRLNAGPESMHAFLGNEPTLQTPYLDDWLGRPSAGAAAVHRALLGLYAPTANGYPGNDDGGEMASWWVLSALGLYPAVPGTDVLALTAPLFPRAAIALPHGRLTIDTAGAGGFSSIAAVSINGRGEPRAWLPFSRLAGGATLHYRLVRAGGRWATTATAAPPSYAPAAVCR